MKIAFILSALAAPLMALGATSLVMPVSVPVSSATPRASSLSNAEISISISQSVRVNMELYCNAQDNTLPAPLLVNSSRAVDSNTSICTTGSSSAAGCADVKNIVSISTKVQLAYCAALPHSLECQHAVTFTQIPDCSIYVNCALCVSTNFDCPHGPYCTQPDVTGSVEVVVPSVEEIRFFQAVAIHAEKCASCSPAPIPTSDANPVVDPSYPMCNNCLPRVDATPRQSIPSSKIKVFTEIIPASTLLPVSYGQVTQAHTILPFTRGQVTPTHTILPEPASNHPSFQGSASSHAVESILVSLGLAAAVLIVV